MAWDKIPHWRHLRGGGGAGKGQMAQGQAGQDQIEPGRSQGQLCTKGKGLELLDQLWLLDQLAG